MEERLPVRKVAANVLNNQSRTADKEWSTSLVVCEVLTTPRHKNWPCYETDTRASDVG